jgi:enamine deaminase RidA (YjgF/YER057c/UK114 family)
MSLIEKRLEELGLELPESPSPVATYVSTRRAGNLLYTSGAGCVVDGRLVHSGKLGSDLGVEQGYEAARVTALNLLSLLKKELGDLDRIKQIVKVLGFVSSADDFYDQPKVINGASDLFVEVLGNKGKHARSAIGVNVLPMNLPVEIELIVEIENE